MYSNITLTDLATWCGCELAQEITKSIPITKVATDSRSIKPGEVFLALKGEHFDGHDYIDAAIKQGAVAIICEKKLDLTVPVLRVENTLKAFVSIGRALRDRFQGVVIAITGSAGKSSTKEMVARLLGEKVVCSPASFNNLIGLSHTLQLVEEDTRYLVLEMGMNDLGEIQELCKHFRPHIGVITNIGDAHIGKLGGLDGIERAKKELFDFLKGTGDQTRGIAVNQDDARVLRAFKACDFHASVPRLFYTCREGDSKAASVSVTQAKVDSRSGYLSLNVQIQKHHKEIELPLFGTHHGQNLAAALAVSTLVGVPSDDLFERAKGIRSAVHRGEILNLKGGLTLIDESYNSNPTALKSALQSLSKFSLERRRLIVLGDMLELGDYAFDLHNEVAEEIIRLHQQAPFEFVFFGVGEQMAHVADRLKSSLGGRDCYHVDEVKKVIPLVEQVLEEGDIIFVKSSRGGHLDKVVASLNSSR